MAAQRVRQHDGEYWVSVPSETVATLDLYPGKLVDVEFKTARPARRESMRLRSYFESSWRKQQRGYRYLADRPESIGERSK